MSKHKVDAVEQSGPAPDALAVSDGKEGSAPDARRAPSDPTPEGVLL